MNQLRIVMMGTGPFAVPTFQSLLESKHDVLALVTRPIRETRGRKRPPPSPMRDASPATLPLLAPVDVNTDEARQELAALKPDLLVVCDYGQILSAATLKISRMGGINLHGSLLPKYRGAAPVNWAILEGDAETGVTVIHMTPRLDAGPCLVTKSTPINPDEDAVQLEDRLSQLGVDAVHEAIAMLSDWNGQETLGALQDPSLATRAPRLSRHDGVVDWSQPARRIANQVRAFKPWPGSYTHWHQEGHPEPLRLILDQVAVTSSPSSDERAKAPEPGEVVHAEGDRLEVQTGDGILAVLKIQPAGKRVMSAAEFLRGHRIPVGDRLGAVEG